MKCRYCKHMIHPHEIHEDFYECLKCCKNIKFESCEDVNFIEQLKESYNYYYFENCDETFDRDNVNHFENTRENEILI